MPIRIQCPTCQASLSMPETMYGKAVRCPNCQSAFQCPPAPAPASAPAAPRRRPESTPAPPARSAGGSAFDVDRGPTPAAPDVFDYDHGHRPRRTSGWDKVRSGIFFLYFSTLCFFLFVALNFAVGLEDLEVTPATTTAKILAVVASLLLLGGAILASIGEGFCCSVPYDSGAKGAITGSTVFMILATLGISVLTVFDLKETFRKESPEERLARQSKESQDPDLVKPIVNLTVVGTFLATVILFFFFLTLASVHLGQWFQVKSIMAYCVAMPLAPLALLMFGYFPEMAAPTNMAPPAALDRSMVKLLKYGPVVVGAVWFALLLAGLSSGAGRASRRAAD
ncbi:MAG: hypothetical protein HYS12_25445 [Planctomycetes bacterium]|nr:hypothetical protein [Planctomycetota bacterium]